MRVLTVIFISFLPARLALSAAPLNPVTSIPNPQSNIQNLSPPLQDWVRDFDNQKILGGIWDGRSVKRLSYLQKIFDHDYAGCDLYVYNDHIHRESDLAVVKTATTKPPVQQPAVQKSKVPQSPIRNPKTVIKTPPSAIQNPAPLTFDKYLYLTYLQGLEADLDRGLIIIDGNCKGCKKGKVVCSVCKGRKIFVEEIQETIILRDQVIKPLYQQVNLLKRQGNTISRRAMAARQRLNTQAMNMTEAQYRSHLRDINNQEEREIRQIEREIAAITEKISREERKPDKEFPTKIITRKVRTKCPTCNSRGWCGCPKCFLKDDAVPCYDPKCRADYIKRFKYFLDQQRKALEREKAIPLNREL